MRRSAFLILAIVSAGLTLLLVSTVSITKIEIDAVTGTVRTSHRWIGSFTSTEIEHDALARRLESLNLNWKPDWKHLSTVRYKMLGFSRSHECSIAPPIHDLQTVQDEFAVSVTPDELRAFVHVMESGSTPAQQKTVDEAIERTFSSLAANTPAR